MAVTKEEFFAKIRARQAQREALEATISPDVASEQLAVARAALADARATVVRLERELAADHERVAGAREANAAALLKGARPKLQPVDSHADEIEVAIELATAKIEPLAKAVADAEQLLAIATARVAREQQDDVARQLAEIVARTRVEIQPLLAQLQDGNFEHAGIRLAVKRAIAPHNRTQGIGTFARRIYDPGAPGKLAIEFESEPVPAKPDHVLDDDQLREARIAAKAAE